MTQEPVVYLVDVGFDGEGYSRRTIRVPIAYEYRGQGDNAAKRAAAEREAIEEYTRNVSARVLTVVES